VFDSLVHLHETSICLIDDGSTDGTYAEFESIRRPHDYAMRFPVNLGISAAVSAGATLASYHDFEVVLQCDGDGQHTGDGVQILINHARKLRTDGILDFVLIGSRFTGTESLHGTSITRIFGSKILRLLLRVLYRRKFTDPTSGLRIYSGRALKLLQHDYPQEWPEPIMLGRLTKSQIEVHEVPVGMATRDFGESKIRGFGSAMYMVKVVTLILADKLFWTTKEY